MALITAESDLRRFMDITRTEEPVGLQDQQVGTTVFRHLDAGTFRQIADITEREGPRQKEGSIITALKEALSILANPEATTSDIKKAAIYVQFSINNVPQLRIEEVKITKAAEMELDQKPVPVKRKNGSADGFVFDFDQIQ